MNDRTGPSGSGFTAPPPPTALPEAPARKAGAPPPPPLGLPKAAAAPPPPESSRSSASKARGEDDDDGEEWKQFIKDDSGDDHDDDESAADDVAEDAVDEQDSGEDSAEGESKDEDIARRRKNDMEALLRQQSSACAPRSAGTGRTPKAAEEPGKEPWASNVEGGHSTEPESRAITVDDGKPVPLFGKEKADKKPAKKSLMSRASSFFTGGSKSTGEFKSSVPHRSILNEHSQKDDAWYQQELSRLGKTGIPCTKIATNGKPYERWVKVDARNLTIEVQGGRDGSKGVLLDDLVDVRLGPSSPEFEKFIARFKRDVNMTDLNGRAAILETPHRTFSFYFATSQQRDAVGYCVVYLLKSKNRGVMAESVTCGAPSEECPRDGYGLVTYQNRSRYEGQFQNSKRHGHGTLILSDGTRYESEWRNDERHGRGTELWADGTTFTGSYVKGMRCGHGVMTWPEGSRYSGQFERGRANGTGQLVRTDGSVYQGRFSEDCMSGYGCMQWRDGVEYVGQFVCNRREGLGKMKWTTGRWKCYEGRWKDGMQHGPGILTDHSDAQFSGVFRSGKLERWDDDV